MKYIVENWFVIVGLIAVCAAGGYAVYVFVKMPSDKQLNKVREWLLYAVTKAEKELGGGTGQIKLRYVYDMFVARFAWLARVISFEAFSMMVDEALERMKKMLESNKAMQTLVSGEAGEVNESNCRLFRAERKDNRDCVRCGCGRRIFSDDSVLHLGRQGKQKGTGALL